MSSATSPSNSKRRYQVPYMNYVQHGIDLLHNPKYNKGLAFTLAERRELKLEGLLPPYVLNQETQVIRILEQLKTISQPLDKYRELVDLANRNEKLFYRVICENIVEMMPLIYTPTVGEACLKFGHIFKRSNGMYFSSRDLGRVQQILSNWPAKNVRAIVFTDGERILGLGDLGTNGMGIPVGKLMLYTACAGIAPSQLLPVCLDVGTNNQALLDDPLYTGLRQRRDRSSAYDELVYEFMRAAQKVFGEDVLLQFEDFGNANAARLLEKHRNNFCTFNDDIQGTASVAVSGVLTALPLTERPKLSQHVIVMFGAGSAGIGIANLLAYYMVKHEGVSSMEAARSQIWLVDSKGLVVSSRAQESSSEKLPFAHDHEELASLNSVVESLKPSILIGATAQPNTFTQEVVTTMSKNSKRPIIFALSNPTSKAECTAEQAYTWSKGQALFSSGSPFPAFNYKGTNLVPGQGNNSYIFPGLALAVVAFRSHRVTDDMFLVAARTLTSQVTKKELDLGTLYPPLQNIRAVSFQIALAVGEEIYRSGLAGEHRPESLSEFLNDYIYDYHYDTFVQ